MNGNINQTHKGKTMARPILATLSLKEVEYKPTEWAMDEKPWTVKVKPMSKRQLAQYKDNSSRMSLTTNSFYFGTSVNAIDIVKTQVTGWDNYSVPFKQKNGVMDDEVLESLYLEDIEEIANHIIKISTVGAEDLEK